MRKSRGGHEPLWDLSSLGNTQAFPAEADTRMSGIDRNCFIPVYDSGIHYQRDLATLTAQGYSVDVVTVFTLRTVWTL